MNIDSTFENIDRRYLLKKLRKLDKKQFKIFYCLLVYYWAKYKYFISTQNFFNLWCDLNQLCHESDESFPSQYDNYEEVKSFCKAYPYYFIDKLPLDVISNLFSMYLDDRVDILTNIVKTLSDVDIFAAYACANKALGLNEPIDILVLETHEHIKLFS